MSLFELHEKHGKVRRKLLDFGIVMTESVFVVVTRDDRCNYEKEG